MVKVDFGVNQHQHGSIPPRYKAPHAMNFGACHAPTASATEASHPVTLPAMLAGGWEEAKS